MQKNVHGNATTATTASNSRKLGGKEATDYKLKGDFAVITSSLTTPDTTSTSVQGAVDINYPKGFNKNNSVIISLMSKNNSMNSEANRKWSTVGINSSGSVVKGNLGLTASLNEENITVWVSKMAQEEQSKNIGIKLILMKV